jgi:hypothetical protein
MTEAELIAACAEATTANLFRWADGMPNAQGKTIHPDHVPAAVQVAGAFEHFAAQIRIALDNVRRS